MLPTRSSGVGCKKKTTRPLPSYRCLERSRPGSCRRAQHRRSHRTLRQKKEKRKGGRYTFAVVHCIVYSSKRAVHVCTAAPQNTCLSFCILYVVCCPLSCVPYDWVLPGTSSTRVPCGANAQVHPYHPPLLSEPGCACHWDFRIFFQRVRRDRNGVIFRGPICDVIRSHYHLPQMRPEMKGGVAGGWCK